MTEGQRFTDQCRLRSRSRIALVEKSAAEQGNAHGLAVTWTDRVAEYIETRISALILKLRTIDGINGRVVAEQQQARECSLLNAGNISNRIKALIKEAAPRTI